LGFLTPGCFYVDNLGDIRLGDILYHKLLWKFDHVNRLFSKNGFFFFDKLYLAPELFFALYSPETIENSNSGTPKQSLFFFFKKNKKIF